MRKLFSVAACALTLVCAGASQAGPEARSFNTAPADQAAPRLQTALLSLENNRTMPRNNVAPEASARTLAPAAVDARQIEGSGTAGMLLAGLMVMGVIIKRRYGKGD